MKTTLAAVKIILIIVITVSIGSVLGAIGYIVSIKNNPPVAIQPSPKTSATPTPEPTAISTSKLSPTPEDKEAKTINGISQKSIYYYNQTYNPAVFSVYKFNLELSVLSEKLFSKEINVQVLSSLKENNKYLFGDENKIYILDVSSGQLQEIFSINKNEGNFMDAAMSNDKNKIAFSLDTDPEMYRNKKAELWIYDLKTKQKNKIFEDVLGLYTGMSVLGWGDSDKYIVLREMGGDAGAIWGGVIIVDTKSPYNVQKINNDRNFLLGHLSPNGNLWLYFECDKPTGEHPIEDRTECEEGEQLKVYDFRTKETKSVYRNISHGNNTMKGKLRTVSGSIWQNDDSIIFSIPDGIYKLVLSTQAATELYKFEWNDPEEVFNQPTYLTLADNDFIVFERYNHYAGKWILDLESGRVTEMTESGQFFQ